MEVEGPLQSVLVTPQPVQRGGMTGSGSDLRKVLSRWAVVAKLWWRCPAERRRAWLYTGACLGLSLANVALLLWISYAQNALQSSLSEKQEAGFYAAVRDFVAIIVIAAPLFALTDYVDSCLTVAWRKWLTQHMIRAYFADHAYFRLKIDPQAIDNPDQRICDDVRAYTSTSVMLSISIMRKLFNCVAFAGLLWSLAPRLAVFLIVYALGGTWITASGFGRRLMQLTYSVLQQEADLRFALVRVRENAESIAFYAGDQREAELAFARLARVITTIFAKVRWEAFLSLWQNSYAYATILLPSLLLHKRYFRGEIRFGDISQASFAFHTIEGALSYIVNHLAEISQLAAQTDRLDALLTALAAQADGLPGGVHRRASKDGGVRIEDLALSTPHGEMQICRGLTLSLAPGQSLLIVGPSGVGKTSLMRAVAGECSAAATPVTDFAGWPERAGLWTAGSGSISAPEDMFFLPQRPYMPLGTLREQLTFPDSYAGAAAAAGSPRSDDSGSSGAGGRMLSIIKSGGGGSGPEGKYGKRDSGSGEEDDPPPDGASGSASSRRLLNPRSSGSGGGASYRRLSSGKGDGGAPSGGEPASLHSPRASPALDAELRRLLDLVCLPNLLSRVGGLDAELDYAHMLSLGEQQRVSFVRLLHHRPAVAFLDEATSALDTATERALYSELQRHCRCYLSIAHRKQLAAFHTHVLEAGGDGSWVLHDAADYLRRVQE